MRASAQDARWLVRGPCAAAAACGCISGRAKRGRECLPEGAPTGGRRVFRRHMDVPPKNPASRRGLCGQEVRKARKRGGLSFTPGILHSALWASSAVQMRSRRICGSFSLAKQRNELAPEGRESFSKKKERSGSRRGQQARRPRRIPGANRKAWQGEVRSGASTSATGESDRTASGSSQPSNDRPGKAGPAMRTMDGSGDVRRDASTSATAHKQSRADCREDKRAQSGTGRRCSSARHTPASSRIPPPAPGSPGR